MDSDYIPDRATSGPARRDADLTETLLTRLPMSTDRLRMWVRQAQPNARLVYGHGGVVAHCCSKVVAEAVRELADKGYLTSHRTKDGEGTVLQLVQRSHRPAPRGIGAL